MMKTVILGMMIILGCVGCRRAEYKAHATVVVGSGTNYPSHKSMQAELNKISDIGATCAGYNISSFSVNHITDTRVMSVSVTSDNPQRSADVCNQIIEQYVAITNDAVTRVIADPARTPTMRQ